MVIKVVAMAGRHGDHFQALMQVPDLFLVINIMLVVKMFDQEACAELEEPTRNESLTESNACFS